jgi:glycosyltransferase involved in cell wall biosynthesis
MKPYLSIIIPYHNSQETIGRLLDSICTSSGAPALEVIVVDDASTKKFTIHNSQIIIPSAGIRYRLKNKKKYVVKMVRQERNRGPAAARNRGAREAKGKFLVFLDSDVELFPDTLANLAKIYLDDPDVVALTGVWVKEQKTKAFFPNFKALRDWSYWINERDKSGYYFLFSTRIASIKKSVFLRLGGFDEKYPGALVEDIELTYRIARRYAIIFAPDVRVKHEFEGFWPIANKYFLRAYYWINLYAKRKKFDPVATTFQEAVTTVSGVGVVGLFIIAILTSAIGYWVSMGGDPTKSLMLLTALKSLRLINIYILGSLGFFLGLHIFLVRKFLAFMAHEKGLWFAVRGFFTGLILYCFITAGVLWAKLHG